MTHEEITAVAYETQRECMRTLGDDVPAYAALSGEEKAMFLRLTTWMCSGDNAVRRRAALSAPAEQAFAEVVIILRGQLGEPTRGM